MTKNTTEELREQLVMEISELRATACNAYQRFHGQEEGEDPVMDRYWKQERKAEEKLYLAIEQLISNREKLARIDELENLPWKRIDKYGINTPYVTKKWLTERKATLRKELDREEPTHE